MQYSLMRKLRLSFIDSDILYRGVLQDRFDCILISQHQPLNGLYKRSIHNTLQPVKILYKTIIKNTKKNN